MICVNISSESSLVLPHRKSGKESEPASFLASSINSSFVLEPPAPAAKILLIEKMFRRIYPIPVGSKLMNQSSDQP